MQVIHIFQLLKSQAIKCFFIVLGHIHGSWKKNFKDEKSKMLFICLLDCVDKKSFKVFQMILKMLCKNLVLTYLFGAVGGGGGTFGHLGSKICRLCRKEGGRNFDF